MRYRDLTGSVDWLRKAFGFEEHQTVKGEDGSVLYSVLLYKNALIMVGPVHATGFDGLMKQPDEIGGAETQSCYIVIDDPVTHLARAKTAGANILFDLKTYDHGGRGYSCRDVEGHIWSFGTYDPWKVKPPLAAPGRPRRPLLWAGAALLLVAVVAGGWLSVADRLATIFDSNSRKLEVLMSQQSAAAAAELAQERHARESAEKAAQSVLAQLAHAKAETAAAVLEARTLARRVTQVRLSRERAHAAAERTASELAKDSAAEREVRQRAERLAKETGIERARERNAREMAEQALAKLREEIVKERQASDVELSAAERSQARLQKDLAAERTAKEAAQRSVQQAQKELKLERGAKEAMEHSTQASEKALIAERTAKEAALAAMQTLQQELARERGAKEEAQRAAEAARGRLAELEKAEPEPQVTPPPAPAAGRRCRDAAPAGEHRRARRSRRKHPSRRPRISRCRGSFPDRISREAVGGAAAVGLVERHLHARAPADRAEVVGADAVVADAAADGDPARRVERQPGLGAAAHPGRRSRSRRD